MSYEQHIDSPDRNPDGRSWDLDAEVEAFRHPETLNVATYAGGLTLQEKTRIVLSAN